MITGARQYTTGDRPVMLANETDPWLQHPDGSVVDLEPHLAALEPGPCGECSGRLFAPTGNGPTEQGIERCDECSLIDDDPFSGDVDAAAELAALIGQGVTVWYLPEAGS
jgi:hypothetical protein